MAKHSMKEYHNFIELHIPGNTDFNKIFSNMKGQKAALRMMYMRLVAKATDSSNGKERWLLKPNGGFTRTCNIEKWMRSNEKYEMDSADLLEYFKASTYRTVFTIMVKEGLIHIDSFNRLTVRYPVNGKMLSLEYAIKAIKSSYKKEASLDTQDDNGVKSDAKTEDIPSDQQTDNEFWNK